MKIYTKFGDDGMTATLSGKTVSKSNCLIKVNGDIDSLQNNIDKMIMFIGELPEGNHLHHIQKKLWQLGGEISGEQVKDYVKDPISNVDLQLMENWIDGMMNTIKLTGFVRFTTPITIEASECRVRTRKLERTLTEYLENQKIRAVAYKYINRLSDYFFALSVFYETEAYLNN